VPDFCGMSMETANALLRDWKDINKARSGRAVPQQRQQSSMYSPPQAYPAMQEHPVDLSSDMGRMRLSGGEPPLPTKVVDHGYGRTPQSPPKDARPDMLPPHMQQAPVPYPPGSPGSTNRPLPGGPAGRSPFPTEPVQPLGPPGRTSSTGYDQPDPFAYQVCNSFHLNRLYNVNFSIVAFWLTSTYSL
jgi:hypothetical protein